MCTTLNLRNNHSLKKKKKKYVVTAIVLVYHILHSEKVDTAYFVKFLVFMKN